MSGEGAESRVRGWSGRRDQVGRWGQCRVGGDEEAESREQKAGCAERQGRGQSEGAKEEKEKGGGTAPTFIGLATGGRGHPEVKRHHLNWALRLAPTPHVAR